MKMNVGINVVSTIDDQDDDWSGICNSKRAFLAFLASRLIASVDTNSLSNIVISDTTPRGEDKNKLWVKTSWPYGIGFLGDGEFQMDYSFTGYPVNTPFLHSEILPLRDNVRKLSDGDITNFGLTNTKTDAKNRMFWYMFTPPSIAS